MGQQPKFCYSNKDKDISLNVNNIYITFLKLYQLFKMKYFTRLISHFIFEIIIICFIIYTNILIFVVIHTFVQPFDVPTS